MANEPSLKPWTYLKRARLRAGYGLATDAAKAIGIGVSHYCSVEKGRFGFSGPTLIRVAEVFGVDVGDLVTTAPQTPCRAGQPRRNDEAAA